MIIIKDLKIGLRKLTKAEEKMIVSKIRTEFKNYGIKGKIKLS